MIQNDYTQYSLRELYGMYIKSLNDKSEESKMIFEEIVKKEKLEPVAKINKNKEAPLFLYLLASARNICGNFILYIGLRFVITFSILETTLPNSFEKFMRIYGYVFFIFFFLGMIASASIKKITGKFNHTKYWNYEIATTLFIVLLLEVFLFN